MHAFMKPVGSARQALLEDRLAGPSNTGQLPKEVSGTLESSNPERSDAESPRAARSSSPRPAATLSQSGQSSHSTTLLVGSPSAPVETPPKPPADSKELLSQRKQTAPGRRASRSGDMLPPQKRPRVKPGSPEGPKRDGDPLLEDERPEAIEVDASDESAPSRLLPPREEKERPQEVEELQARNDKQQKELEEVLLQLDQVRKENLEQQREQGQHLLTLRKHFNRELVASAKKERDQTRTRLNDAGGRLGTFKSTLGGFNGHGGTLTGGLESDEIDAGLRRVAREKRQVESARKNLQAQERKAERQPKTDEEQAERERDEFYEQKEFCNTRMLFLSREENILKKREAKLHQDRVVLMKKIKTFRAQETSRWRDFPCLGKKTQYQLLNMLGKGGFSEVWKSYDMESHCYVAVKIHEVKKDFTEEMKESYVRHALREYEIQHKINHPRVVGLVDRFPIDPSCFATVMEYSEGEDLDTYLKANGTMSEKEARGILVQIMAGLKCFNSGERHIIHYDLKPGNIMIERGEIKITDFGLSKVVEQQQAPQGLELTTPGAGTYWYLPPECFGNQAKITCKVDVWSAGVIFYELLFCRKPYGHGISQDQLFRSGSLCSPSAVEFPSAPKVSNECKDLIRRMLTADVEKRPDVFTVCNDPYLRPPPAPGAPPPR